MKSSAIKFKWQKLLAHFGGDVDSSGVKWAGNGVVERISGVHKPLNPTAFLENAIVSHKLVSLILNIKWYHKDKLRQWKSQHSITTSVVSTKPMEGRSIVVHLLLSENSDSRSFTKYSWRKSRPKILIAVFNFPLQPFSSDSPHAHCFRFNGSNDNGNWTWYFAHCKIKRAFKHFKMLAGSAEVPLSCS